MDLKVQTSYRQILGISLPISLAILVPQINFVTNNVFLGGLGELELASAGITGVYYLIFAVIGSGLNNGLQSLIARRAGQDRKEEIGHLFFHGVWISMGIALFGIVITYIAAPFVLHAAIHHQPTADLAIDFLMIRIWGLPLLYLYAMRNALLVGINQTRLLVWGTIAETVTNILLDYGFIYGHFGLPQLGFNGAAYASIIAEGAGLLVIYTVTRMSGIHKLIALERRMEWVTANARLIMVQSSPLIAQYAISILSWEFFYLLVEHHGERALAISNTMRNIFGLAGVFCWSFASATNTMVSNLIGQKRQEEVMPLVVKVVKLSLSVSLAFFVVLNLWPGWFLSFYGQGDAFIAEGIPVVRIVSVALFLMSFGSIWLNAVTGTGNTRVNLFIEMITIVMYCIYVFITLEYLNLPITWGWASEWVYWVSMFTMAIVYMKSGRWKGKEI